MSSAGTISFTEITASEKATTNDGFWETKMFKSWKEDTDPLEEKATFRSQERSFRSERWSAVQSSNKEVRGQMMEALLWLSVE